MKKEKKGYTFNGIDIISIMPLFLTQSMRDEQVMKQIIKNHKFVFY